MNIPNLIFPSSFWVNFVRNFTCYINSYVRISESFLQIHSDHNHQNTKLSPVKKNYLLIYRPIKYIYIIFLPTHNFHNSAQFSFKLAHKLKGQKISINFVNGQHPTNWLELGKEYCENRNISSFDKIENGLKGQKEIRFQREKISNFLKSPDIELG